MKNHLEFTNAPLMTITIPADVKDWQGLLISSYEQGLAHGRFQTDSLILAIGLALGWLLGRIQRRIHT